MGILPFVIGTSVVFIIGMGFITIEAIKVFKKEKQKAKFNKMCTDEAKEIEVAAATYFEDICLNKQLFENQNNYDLALLIALMNNSDLKDFKNINGITQGSLEKAVGKMPEKCPPLFYVEDEINKRIEELYRAEFKEITTPINYVTIAIMLEMQSDTVKKIIRKAQRIEDGLEIPDNTEKKTIFYNHNYPVDETIVTLKKHY